MKMANLDELILAVGNEAKEAIASTVCKKKHYVALKDGQQLRGFLLTTKFVMYISHSDFKQGIKSHVCTDPKHGKSCLSCQYGVRRQKKTIVPFWNVDTKQVEIFDAPNGAMRAIYAYLDEYEDESTTTAIVLMRAGNDTGTRYTLMPIRVKPAEKDLFVIPDNVVIDRHFYESFLQKPSEEYVRKLIGVEEQYQLTDIAADDTDVLPF
jgi:hypothetical protein